MWLKYSNRDKIEEMASGGSCTANTQEILNYVVQVDVARATLCHTLATPLMLPRPGSYKTFFIDVLFQVSFSFSERSWISSMVEFNANKLSLLSEGSGSSS